MWNGPWPHEGHISRRTVAHFGGPLPAHLQDYREEFPHNGIVSIRGGQIRPPPRVPLPLVWMPTIIDAPPLNSEGGENENRRPSEFGSPAQFVV